MWRALPISHNEVKVLYAHTKFVFGYVFTHTILAEEILTYIEWALIPTFFKHYTTQITSQGYS